MVNKLILGKTSEDSEDALNTGSKLDSFHSLTQITNVFLPVTHRKPSQANWHYLEALASINFNSELKEMHMKTILVIEDFLHARHVICRKLQNRGYNTLGASSVREAYDFLSHESNKINLVLSDVDITDRNGFDLLKTIKKNPSLKHIPIAFWAIDSHPSHSFFKEIDRAINTKGSMINLVA